MGTTTVEVARAIDERENLSLELTRVIRASKQRIFDAWCRPDFIRQWFAPHNLIVTDVRTDLNVGGQYRIDMQGADPRNPSPSAADMSRRVGVTGRYITVEPYDLLSFTWQGEWDPGNNESLVTIRLRDVEGGTELKLTHERFATEASRDGHQAGWTNGLAKLERLLESNG